MHYTEELLWILDYPGTTIHDQDEKFQKNIAFVHSLGLKCDRVGWSKLNLADPRTNEILTHIAAFCKENGWTARGCYTRQYAEVNSDWFEILPHYFKDSTTVDRIQTTTEDMEQVSTQVIRAFYETEPSPKTFGCNLFVPERLRNCCVLHNHSGVDFCWAKDIGKYEAEQYFHLYAKHQIPQIAVDFNLRNSPQRIQAAGGWLPRLAEVFHTLQFVNLPDCYLAEDLPKCGFAYAYIPITQSCAGKDKVLVHKDIAQTLIKEKAIPAQALKPVAVVDKLPGGYILVQTQSQKRPSYDFMAQMLLEYEKHKAKPRPVRVISEKEALKLMRNAKANRKADFQKSISKSAGLDVQGTEYAPVIVYYTVANGGFLSDEYQLLPYNQALKANEEFHRNWEKEELLTNKPAGIVIAKCADGDHILLRNDGVVIRFSHEMPEITEQWPSLAQFIVNAING